MTRFPNERIRGRLINLGGEAGEDHEVGVKLDLLDPSDAERAESPLVLQAAELALDG